MKTQNESDELSALLEKYRALAKWACVNMQDMHTLDALEEEYSELRAKKLVGAV